MNPAASLSALLVVAVIAAVVFLVFREFFTWYWKQNAIIEELRQMRAEAHLTNIHLAELRTELHNRAQGLRAA